MKTELTETHHLRWDFTESELKEFSKTMARAAEEVAITEIDKKVANTQFAEQIARHQSVMSQMARNINSGYEMRMVKCRVLLDTPVRGTARIVRTDTGTFVKERVMTEREIQDQSQMNLSLAATLAVPAAPVEGAEVEEKVKVKTAEGTAL